MALDTRTPAWLESLSARPYEGLNKLANMTGRYIGAGIDAALPSNDEATDKQPYLNRFRSSLQNQDKFAADPNFRMREMLARAQYDASRMQGEQMALRGAMAFKSLQQQTEGEKELAELAAQAQSKGNDPLAVNYMGSNPYTQKMWGNTQLQYSRGLVQKRLDSDRVQINKLVNDLDPEDRSVFLQMPRGDDGMPTPEGWAFLKEAGRRTVERKNEARFKNLPLEAQMYEQMKTYEEKGDTLGVEVMQDALARKKAASLSKADHAILTDALVRRRQAQAALRNSMTQLVPAAKAAAQKDAEAADILVNRLLQMQSSDTPAPGTNAPAAPPSDQKTQFQIGVKVKQNGKTYQFDGAKWNEVQ